MNRIDATFQRLRSAGARGLMPFIVGGRPGAAATGQLLETLDQAGADIIEIGFPFSDPIADGPVIAAAMHHALEAGVTPAGVLSQIAAARSRVTAGLVGMVSVSIVHRMGPRRFVEDAKSAGLDGLIFPDAPLGEVDELLELTRAAGLTATLLIAPTTPPERAERVARKCSGFIYLLARLGITGEAAGGPPEVAGRVGRLRQVSDLPIACGFGIATAEHVRAVTTHADAAIVGSALVRRLEEASEAGNDPAEAGAAFVRELRTGLSQY